MPLFGAHAFIWAGEWTPEGAEKVIRGAAEAGLDFVEIPLLHPESMDVSGTGELLDRFGIGCTCSLGLPKAAHLPFAPDRAEAFLKEAVDVTASLGAPALSRSEEHTSELQSRQYLVCRLLLEKKNATTLLTTEE